MKNLKIINVSAIPQITSVKNYTPIKMIDRKAIDMIIGDS